MSDHEFEKQVQARMGELKLRPSEAVWTHVERRIRRERRRRRLVLWIPLLLLMLGAGGYFVFTNQPAAGPSTTATHTTTPSANHQNTVTPDNNSTQTTPGTETATDPSPVDKNKSTANKDNNNDHQERSPITIKQQPGKNQLRITGQQPVFLSDLPIKNKKDNPANIVEKDNNIADKETGRQVAVVEDPPVRDRSETTGNVQPTDSAMAMQPASTDSATIKKAAVLPQNELPNTATAVLPPAKAKTKKSSNWQWGIQGNAGGSHIAKGGLFDILNSENKALEDLASNAYAFPSPIPIPVNKPSEIRTGKSWSIGGFIQKPLSKRFSLSTGVQYSYFSVHTQVGTLIANARTVNNALSVSQVVDRYYQGSTNQATPWGGYRLMDYTNRYHFLEIPVTLHTQLNKGKRLPIILDLGVTASRLLTTTALHYDGTNDVYYKDNSFFNKTQLAITSTVNVALFHKKAHPVWIGPRINYQLTNLLKKEVSAGQHLWSFGVNAKFFLKK